MRGSTTTVNVSNVEIRDEIPAERFSLFALEFGDVELDAR